MTKSREQAVAGVTSGLIAAGEEVTWRAWHFGVPLRMTSRITQLEAPDRFIDEQTKGPFRWFRHIHEFSHDSRGTTMVDRIDFAAPFGDVGRLVEKLFLARYLQKLIEERNLRLHAGAVDQSSATVAWMLLRSAFISALIVAGDSRHECLRFLRLYVGQEARDCRPAER